MKDKKCQILHSLQTNTKKVIFYLLKICLFLLEFRKNLEYKGHTLYQMSLLWEKKVTDRFHGMIRSKGEFFISRFIRHIHNYTGYNQQ